MRATKIDGEPWLVAADLANVLGYGRTNSLNKLLDPEDRQNKAFLSGANSVNQPLISEAGLYQAIMSSTLPAAKRCKRWVTGSVLPAIRKDGAYIMGEEKVATGERHPGNGKSAARRRGTTGELSRLLRHHHQHSSTRPGVRDPRDMTRKDDVSSSKMRTRNCSQEATP